MHPDTPSEIAAVVLLDIAVIVVIARLMGLLFQRIGQPAVVAEIVAALILGPSLLGTLPGNPTEALFPDPVRPYLSVIAALGLTIFMFIVGLELDLGLIRGKGRVAATISVSSIILPFAMGSTLALWLHGSHNGNGVDLLPFVLFIGAAMSVTAFPVLARILAERGIQRTQVGALALACAAVDDVLAWTMLAGVLAIVRSTGATDLFVMLAESLAFVAVMFVVVKPQLRKLVARREAAGRLTPNIFSVVLVGVLLSSFITDEIGIHAIFGAFLFGTIMPRQGAEQLTQEILERVEQLTVLVLLPVFFIITGLQVDINDLGASGLLELLAVLAVACAGKFLGAALAARASRVPTRRAAAVGILMNARGLTELVILSVGKAAGVLDDRLFTIMVLMAIITTVMTEPLLRLVYPDHIVAREIAQAERDALGAEAGYRVIAAIGEDHADDTVDVATALVGDEPAGQVVISRIHPALPAMELGSGLTTELAAVAESFESMQALSRRASHHGASVVVRSQFSEHVVADLASQVAAVAADVLVLDGGDADRTAAILTATDTTVAVVVPVSEATRDRVEDATGGALLVPVARVAVVLGHGEDSLAAIEQACRIASRDALPVDVVMSGGRRENRRAGSVAARLTAAGIVVTQLDSPDAIDAATTQAVIGWDDWMTNDSICHVTHRPVIAVRSAAGDAGERLTAWLKGRSRAV